MNILNSKNLDKGNVPKDILTLRKIFDSLGIEEYEKNTLNFMSEFLNTYITDLLNDAKKNMLLANRNKINIEDIKLAVKTKQNILYKNKLNVDDLKSLAYSVNRIELPNIPDSPNVLMPPFENSLLKNNFQVYSDNLYQFYHNNEHLNEENTILKTEIPMLGFKRKDEKLGDNKKSLGNPQRKKRKLSLTQAFKSSKEKEENAKKEKNKIKIENDFNEKGDNNDIDEGADPIFENVDNISNFNEDIEMKRDDNLTSHKQSSEKFESIHNDDDDGDLNEDDFKY